MINHGVLAQICLESYHAQTFSFDDVEVLVMPVNGCNVVAIRGTELSEWRDISRVLLGSGSFESAAYGVAMRLFKYIDAKKPTIITGHSVGGCIAIALSRMIDCSEVVVFGAIRASQLAGCKCTSYIHANDAVPKLLYPLCWTTGEKVYLAKHKRKSYKLSIKDHLLQGYIDELTARA